MKLENVLLAIVLALGLFVIVAASIKTNPTESKANVVLADEREQAIISKMCPHWKSTEAEGLILLSTLTHDYNREQELQEEWADQFIKDQHEGEAILMNDTLFLRCVRSDSLYNAMFNERKALAKKLKVYRNKIPEFKTHIERICKDVIEYNCFRRGIIDENIEIGIYEWPIKEKSPGQLRTEEFYNSYTDLLKEALAVTETQISDEDIKTIFSLIKDIEHIDRHTWTIPEYKKREKEFEEKQAQEERMRRIDSLTKAAS